MVDSGLLEAASSGDVEVFETLDTTSLSVNDIRALVTCAIEHKHISVVSALVDHQRISLARFQELLRACLKQEMRVASWMLVNSWKGGLEQLDFSACELDALPSLPAAVCPQVKELDLSNNNLEFLSLNFNNFTSLSKVVLDGNPLSLYPERCRTSWPKMREYLLSLETRTSSWCRKRLVVVGTERVGKTALVRALKKKNSRTTVGDYQPSAPLTESTMSLSTSGSEVDVPLTVLDLAGNPNYYASHQCFITAGALFLVVFNLVDGPNVSDVSHWLQQAHRACCARQSQEEPAIILVGTHSDDKNLDEQQVQQRVDQVSEQYPRYRHRHLKGVVAVSCKNGKGIPELKELIASMAIQNSNRGSISSPWVFMHDAVLLHCRSHGLTYLERYKYVELGKKAKLQGSVLQACTQFLVESGSIMVLQDKEQGGNQENDIVVISPQWVMDLMSLFTDPSSPHIKNGVLSPEAVPELLRPYKAHLHQTLVNVLSDYNIIQFMNSGQYLVPMRLRNGTPYQLLSKSWPSEPPRDVHEQQRVFQFAYAPVGFLSHMIVRLLNVKNIQGDLFWDRGMQISCLHDSQRALLTLNEASTELHIRFRIPIVDSCLNGTELLLRHVVNIVEMLLECYYPRLSTKRLVPCSHCIGKRKSIEPYVFTYTECMEAVVSGKPYVYCHGIHSDSRCIQMDDLAPDISFADLPKIDNKDLTIGEELGEGAFGMVYKGELSGKAVAIKTIKLCHAEEERSKFCEFQQESYLMSALDNDNLVKLYGITSSPPQIVMEFVEHGDLFNLMHPLDPTDPDKRRRNRLTEEEFPMRLRLLLALDIAKGMQYLQHHSPAIIHRDLRSPNVFISSIEEGAKVYAKVADFGLARFVNSSIAGTLNSWQWLAPEVIHEDSQEYDLRSDVYSFGMVLWELMALEYPYDEFLTAPRFSRKITDGNGNSISVLNPAEIKAAVIKEHLRPSVPSICSETVSQLITSCWSHSPKKRPSFDDVVYTLSTELEIQTATFDFSHRGGRETSSRRFSIPINKATHVDHECSVNVQPYRWMETRDCWVECLLTVPELNEVWAGTSNGSIVLFSAWDFKEKLRFPEVHTQRVRDLLRCGDRVWSCAGDGRIHIWETDATIYRTISHPEKAPIKCLALATSGDELQVWSCSPRDKSVSLWSSKGDLLQTLTFNRATHIMQSGGSLVYLGMDDGFISAVSTKTMQAVCSWQAHSSTIGALLVDGEELWSGSDDGVIKVWKVTPDGGVSAVHSKGVHAGPVTYLLCVEEYIWSASQDHTIIIWDRQFNPVFESQLHREHVTSLVRYSEQFIWTSSGDGTVRIWRNGSLAPLGSEMASPRRRIGSPVHLSQDAQRSPGFQRAVVPNIRPKRVTVGDKSDKRVCLALSRPGSTLDLFAEVRKAPPTPASPLVTAMADFTDVLSEPGTPSEDSMEDPPSEPGRPFIEPLVLPKPCLEGDEERVAASTPIDEVALPPSPRLGSAPRRGTTSRLKKTKDNKGKGSRYKAKDKALAKEKAAKEKGKEREKEKAKAKAKEKAQKKKSKKDPLSPRK